MRWSLCPYCGAAQGGETAGKPERVEAPAARWRATARRRRPAAAVAEEAIVAATTEPEIADVDATATGDDGRAAASQVPASAEMAARPPLPEPIPLVPAPKNRFRRQSNGGHLSGAGRAPAGGSSDQVSVGGLFTSILGSRNGNGNRSAPVGERFRRLPESAEPSSRRDGLSEGKDTGQDLVVTATEPVATPESEHSNAYVPVETEGEHALVTVRAEGKGD
jgi:hypothetical protein